MKPDFFLDESIASLEPEAQLLLIGLWTQADKDGRLDRQGQKLPVIVKMLVAEGTRDELVAECLAMKQDAQDKLFSILKRLIKAIRKS